MQCPTCQNELLAATNPGQPSPEAAEHLAGCPACQEWQRQLLLIERNVSRIPVPTTQTKEVLLRRLVSEPVPVRQPATLPLPRRSWRMPAIAVAGLVAAVILIACGIFLGNFLSRSLRPGGPAPLAKRREPASTTSRKQTTTVRKGPAAPAPSPLLARILACDVTLAEAGTPRQRLESLASLADALQGETRAVAKEAGGAKNLPTLARLYEKVVRDGIVARAGTVPAAERPAVLMPIAERLRRTTREVREMAGRSGPLLQIAAVAEAGDRQLRKLMEETP
jgi:hypothetical protein